MLRKPFILWLARLLHVDAESLLPPVPATMEWVNVKNYLPPPTDLCAEYLICHYNDFMEVAKYVGGEWLAVSNRVSEPDYKLSQEGQPDYWLLIERPERKETCSG
jgi:hypothetical protein